jgi:Uma2 family endonuclease
VGKPCKVYSSPFGVRLPKGNEANEAEIETVVEPDIAVICDRSKLDARGCKGAPDLIIEVISPSSDQTDRLVKVQLYEKSGVKEYWVVQPDEKTVTLFIRGDVPVFLLKHEYNNCNSTKLREGYWPSVTYAFPNFKCTI